MYQNNIFLFFSPVALSKPYKPKGLDLVELRAVWAALPLKFENDVDERKSEWRLKVYHKTQLHPRWRWRLH